MLQRANCKKLREFLGTLRQEERVAEPGREEFLLSEKKVQKGSSESHVSLSDISPD
jgi:hypothetical protein